MCCEQQIRSIHAGLAGKRLEVCNGFIIKLYFDATNLAVVKFVPNIHIKRYEAAELYVAISSLFSRTTIDYSVNMEVRGHCN